MNKPKRFSKIFKLSSGKVQLAFGIAKRRGSIDGMRLLHAASADNAFIIAITRTVKGSVVRNILRRRIKAIIHDGIKTYGPLQAGVILCVVYPSATKRSYQELSLILHNTLWPQKNPD